MDVEARRLESEGLLAAGRAEAAMHELRRAAGLPAAAPLLLKDTLEVLVRVGVAAIAESGRSVEDATRIRPDVQAAEVRVHLADAYVRRARSEGRFDVSLFGSYTRMDAGFPQRALGPTGDLERVRGRFQYVAVGAMVVLPLRHRNQGELAAARAQQASAAANLDAAHLTARAEVAAAVARASQSERALAPYASGVQLARQNLDVVRQTYELGRMTVGDVLAEQRRYLEMERGYTAAMREAFEARTDLQRAKGEL
jgi:cobalt-zinc-cadmium efflux system outer membrane protein